MATDAGGVLWPRALAFFVVWLAVAGWGPKDVLIGAAAAVGASFVSRVFYPRPGFRIRPGALATLAVKFVRGSIVAGFDVARRALSPEMRLRPGFVSFALQIPAGTTRSAFCALASLQPGTLPTGTDGDTLAVHALDLTLPVGETLSADERLFMRAFGYD